MFDFVDAKTVFIIFHLLGAVVGMGGAFVSDAMFLKSSKDKVFTREEVSFMNLGGTMVWIGLAIIVISGGLLFSLNPEGYLASSKFISKMTIVGIIILNGIVVHAVHLPVMKRAIDTDLMGIDSEYRKKSFWLYVSGAVSVTSWLWTLVLGVFRGIPYSVGVILAVYFATLLVALLFAMLQRKSFFNVKKI